MEDKWVRWPRLVAVIGLIAALASAVIERDGGVAILALKVACAGIVPLGLALTGPRDQTEPSIFYRSAVILLPFDAAGSVFGWRSAPGEPVAVGCAVGHLVVCVLIGFHGLVRLWSRRSTTFLPMSELAIDVGLFLLPVGSVWLLATRAHLPLLGFQEPVVLFTAAHFHYAGFAAPLVIGATGRAIGERPSIPFAFGAIVVCAGVPLTAIGIATNHTVEVVAACALATGMLVASGILLLVATRRAWPRSRAATLLFVLAGSALVLTMGLATAFATTSSAGRGSSLIGAIPIQTMIDVHGGGNAFGFALSALVALTMLDLRTRSRAHGETRIARSP